MAGWCRHEAIRLSDELRDRVILTLHRHATFTALANAMGYPEVQPLHAIVYARRGHELARTTIRRIEHWLKSGEPLAADTMGSLANALMSAAETYHACRAAALAGR